MERFCLDCDTPVVGRSDKKFCDDACRSNYNNRIKSKSDRYIRKINGILRRNRSILKEHNPEGKVKIKMKKLQSDGFNFDFSTNQYKTARGDVYYFCYEYGYLLLPPDDVLLVIRKED